MKPAAIKAIWSEARWRWDKQSMTDYKGKTYLELMDLCEMQCKHGTELFNAI